MKRIIALFVAFSCMLFVISSCKGSSSIDSVYTCGISNFQSSGSGTTQDPPRTDLGTIENYIKQNNCPWGDVIIRAGKSAADNDKKMKAQFDAAASKLDFSTLGLSPSTSFVYSATNIKNEIVASVSYNK